MNTEIALYADDSVIYSSSDKVEKVIDNIQTHLDEVQNWALSWKIVLNPPKRCSLHITQTQNLQYSKVQRTKHSLVSSQY